MERWSHLFAEVAPKYVKVENTLGEPPVVVQIEGSKKIQRDDGNNDSAQSSLLLPSHYFVFI